MFDYYIFGRGELCIFTIDYLLKNKKSVTFIPDRPEPGWQESVVDFCMSNNVKIVEFNQINIDNKLNSDNKIVEGFILQPLPPIPTDYFLLVKGFGAGHGVGMSQWGAKSMADRGASFYEILKHYYTGVEIKKTY